MSSRDSARVWLPALALGVAVAGTLGWWLGAGSRGGLSFLGGYLLALTTITIGTMLVVIAARMSPALGLVAAMTNYLLTVLVFLLALKSVNRDEVNVAAVLTGLVAALLPYLVWQFRNARPRPFPEADGPSTTAPRGQEHP